MHDEAFLIKILTGFGSGFSEIQLAVNVVFDERDVVGRDEGHEGFLGGIGHAGALRVAEVGHAKHRLNGKLFEAAFEAVEIETGDGIGKDFDHLEAKAFDGLVHAEIGGAFHGYRVAVLRNSFEADGDGF